ncbi:MAG: hypothetical protein H7138_06255, partial [Myxococcales bacterium]|nr:hypothetical protein [Myxococcales bacterium]
MARPIAVVGALVILSGGAAVGYAVTRKATTGMSPDQSAAMTSSIGQLDGEMRAARAAVRERASTLSSIPQVRAVIATDAATVADAVRGGELRFPTADGEILELGRNVKATNSVELLLLVPTGAMRKSHDGAVGSYVELVGEQIAITEVATVTPSDEASQAKFAGFLSVTRPLALAPMIQPLLDAGITGQLVIGGNVAPIGAMPAGATTRDYPLGSQDGAKIVA